MRVFLFFIGIVFSVNAMAQNLEQCVQHASEKYNISPVIFYSIMKVESRGGQPYAINVAKKSYYPRTYSDAVKIIESNSDQSFDIGAMQINKWWFKRFDYDYKYGLDICWNIDFGGWILAHEMNRHGYTWAAIGNYHSKTKELQDKYITLVAKAMKELSE